SGPPCGRSSRARSSGTGSRCPRSTTTATGTSRRSAWPPSPRATGTSSGCSTTSSASSGRSPRSRSSASAATGSRRQSHEATGDRPRLPAHGAPEPPRPGDRRRGGGAAGRRPPRVPHRRQRRGRARPAARRRLLHDLRGDRGGRGAPGGAGRAPAPPAGGDRAAGPAEAHAGAGVPPRHGDPHRRAGREDPARHLRRHGDAAGRRGPVSRRPRRGGSGPTGIAIVDKPAGWTSHDVVAKARGLLGTRKVGHSGTLDPDATGVLVLGVGRATRLLTFLSGLDKRYVGEVVLGVATTTLDA